MLGLREIRQITVGIHGSSPLQDRFSLMIQTFLKSLIVKEYAEMETKRLLKIKSKK